MVVDKIREIIATVDGTIGLAAKNLVTGEEIMINEHEDFVAASVIKVPIMVEVFRQVHEGKLRLDQKVAITAEEQVGGSGVIYELSPGVELPVIDLVNLMIVVSDNSATNILIDLVGAENVSKTMAELGLKSTKLYNKLMIVPVKRPGVNNITPWDMTHLFAQMAKGRVISWLACQKMIEIMKRQQVRDLLPQSIQIGRGLGVVGALPKYEIAHKTGTISGVRHDSGIVYLPDTAYAITILSKNLIDETESVKKIIEILRLVNEHFA